jgi:aspartate/methionine/tyrosine aminotransferase
MEISPFKLERFFAKYEFKAPYLLCSSDCESMTTDDLLALEPGSFNEFRKVWLGYTESQGAPELKTEISKLYERVNPSDVLAFSGAEEGIFVFMNAALKPGDHIIVQYPCYQSLSEIAASIGCEITKWEITMDEQCVCDLQFLKDSIKKNTKAIIVNIPHNPTGFLMNRNEFTELVGIARKNNLILFSDEVYRFLEYDENDRLPAACDLYENAVSLGVMSKTFGLAGLRIGWIATRNRDLFGEIALFKDYTSICSSAPSEFLSIVALRNKEKIIKRNLDIVLDNLTIADRFFSKYKDLFQWSRPKAGSVAFPAIRMNMNIEDFCIDLVEKKGVLLLPGNYFDPESKHFRMGLGRKNLSTCIEKLDEYMQER